MFGNEKPAPQDWEVFGRDGMMEDTSKTSSENPAGSVSSSNSKAQELLINSRRAPVV
jgi:hypothetical protein